MDTGTQDLEDLKYLRMGYIDHGRKSDGLLKTFLTAMPGDGVLPLRWHYRSLEHFLRKHAAKGMVLWAASANSHLLVINGQRVLRIWTDTEHACYVDMNGAISSILLVHSWGKPETIPAKNVKKSKPFEIRWRMTEQYQMLHLAAAVKRAYGLDK